MPQAPMIIPIVIAGITLGSLLVSEKHALSKKKLLGLSALAGILNLGNAYLVYQLFPPPTLSRVGTSQFSQFRAAATAGSESTFYVSSFLVGFLIVLAVVGIALAYAHFRRHKTEEEGEEEEEKDETKLEDEDSKA